MQLFCLINILAAMLLSAQPKEKTDSKADNDKIHMLTYKKTFSKNYDGWQVSYTEFDGKTNDFVLPITFSFGNRKVKANVLKKSNIESLNNYVLGLGFNGYQKLVKGLYLNMGLGTSIGVEARKKTTQEKSKRFLLGISPRLGMLFIPFSGLGVVLGGSVSGEFTTSKILKNELSFELEIGINF